MEGWSRLRDEQRTSTEQISVVEEDAEKDFGSMEEEHRRKDNKRAADHVVFVLQADVESWLI